MIYLKLLKESFIFAYQSLVLNKLRSFLSLLGITIGIFAIISVFAVIDSLEKNIEKSISTLGDDVIYIQKWPWEFGPDYPWWKYINRPLPSLKEAEELKKRSKTAEAISFSIQTEKTVQFGNISVENVNISAVSHEYENIRSFSLSNGRYFSTFESNSGKNRAIIGSKLASELFNNENPIGREIKLLGRKVMVIGVFEKEGEDVFRSSLDNTVLLPINFARNLLDINNEMLRPMIMVKAIPGVGLNELEGELHQIMRSVRKQKPKVEDNFALNRASLISKGFEQIFVIIDIAGILIGGFSILVGAFGIANIMFVSVRERTKLIGIQKALGAKNYFILTQFLFESVVLCLIGGIAGLLLIFGGISIASNMVDMDFFLSFGNIVTGITISVVTGIVAGLWPAISASRLNPVVAMNSAG
ncbi:MAG: ABC transporter permease [Bacteroidales bacterium]|nr:ABC transporter permease [Bacteroidales bacterium]